MNCQFQGYIYLNFPCILVKEKYSISTHSGRILSFQRKEEEKGKEEGKKREKKRGEGKERGRKKGEKKKKGRKWENKEEEENGQS